MKVGTICKLKVDCLGNKPGTLGVVFYEFYDSIFVIFENGNHERFLTKIQMGGSGRKPMVDSEALAFLEEVGFEESLAGYQFKNVLQVSADFRNGLFNIVWSKKLEKPSEIAAPKEYEKCEVYTEGDEHPFLRFKRYGGGCFLSSAIDYADFSHFEYAEFPSSALPRWIQGDKTLYPQFVVFSKKQ